MLIAPTTGMPLPVSLRDLGDVVGRVLWMAWRSRDFQYGIAPNLFWTRIDGDDVALALWWLMYVAMKRALIRCYVRSGES